MEEKIEPGFKIMLLIKELKHWAYLISWILKITSICIIAGFKQSRTIVANKVKFIKIQRKLHFILFNINILDMVYFGTRSIFHTSPYYKYTF